MPSKTILITGSTDGIGLEAAKLLVSQGHHVIVHGRTPSKLEKTVSELKALGDDARVEGMTADLSDLTQVTSLADSIAERFPRYLAIGRRVVERDW